MEHKHASNEFEALIDDDGRITVPAEMAKQFSGRRLHVRLHREEISVGLREKDVTEDEVERIARVQLESREQVVKFLLTEGTLKGNTAFLRRAGKTKH